METVVWAGVPTLTPAGRFTKVSLTLSPSSLSESSVAVKVKLFSVSPELKVRLVAESE